MTTDNARPIMQRCTRCGQDWWDSHVCTPPNGVIEQLQKMLPPAPPAPLPQGLRLPPSQLTEAEVRRIVREELQRAGFPSTSQGTTPTNPQGEPK